ncbi:hypothetical protein PsorP6_007172 [Peronosclerospora sorghi]|uniref:Uncharacterized protein n=1 Tax=Peronosclerospora sorghi TaxID=230839 RepID=A0ACC0W6R8_9STRA|nr:hypothetical protein PsorP6_007172 [Peronosclerospora sorghi]
MLHFGPRNVLKIINSHPYLPNEPDYPNNSDDMRYHLGKPSVIEMSNAKHMEVNLAANPSHLEEVNPVVLGQARSCQTKLGDNGS